jgi:hypothetical protein
MLKEQRNTRSTRLGVGSDERRARREYDPRGEKRGRGEKRYSDSLITGCDRSTGRLVNSAAPTAGLYGVELRLTRRAGAATWAFGARDRTDSAPGRECCNATESLRERKQQSD